MGTKDKRIDAYIGKAADFAQPILREIRAIIHQGCPEVEETMKWSMPFFMYKDDMLCHMAAFKQHCALGFWKASLIIDKKESKSVEAMGQFGRITSMKDLPSKSVLVSYVKEAKRLNDEGIKKASKPKAAVKKELEVPSYFMAALKRNRKSLATFEGFPYSHKKEYVQWVTEAKTDETRDRRLQTTVEWLAEGKSRNWKYEKC
jgi:uncharacterized protein YdeI (YjbR/CyaY-like superfamily)